MPFNRPEYLDFPIGEPPVRAICEPVPVVKPLTCRRGTGERAFCQGQPIPKCDGVLENARIGQQHMFACSKCGLTHDVVIVDGELRYGAVL